MKAIDTQYKGYLFRSRLEARWAVFFDALGLNWEYEPEGFDLSSGARYLPDFCVEYPGQKFSERTKWWFEVKGNLKTVSHNEWAKMIEFEDNVNNLVLLDGPPDVRLYSGPRMSCTVLTKVKIENIGDAMPPKDYIPMPFHAQEHTFSADRDGWLLWSSKGRPWWECYDNLYAFPEWLDVINEAVTKARSARFEFACAEQKMPYMPTTTRGTHGLHP